MEPIGRVHSCFKNKFATPRQSLLATSSWGFLEVDPKWQPETSLAGLEEFSHVWVIFQFHLNSNRKFHSMISPPRLDGERRGVFATRSPHHPNALGLSLVKMEERKATGLVVSGLDLVDGTPLFDIKPYIKHIECVPEAKSGWTDTTKPALALDFSDEAQAQLQAWAESHSAPVEQLLREVLREDPRPVRQRDRLDKIHIFDLFDRCIQFRFVSTDTIEVMTIKPSDGQNSDKERGDG